jgi:hypothetical protein
VPNKGTDMKDWKKDDMPLETMQTRTLIVFGVITLLLIIFSSPSWV